MTHNVPRKIYFMALLLLIISIILSANRHVELGVTCALAGIFFGFIAFGLARTEDG